MTSFAGDDWRGFQSKIKMKYKEQNDQFIRYIVSMQEENNSASEAVTIDDSNAKLATPVAKKRGRPTKKVAEPRL